MMIWNHIIQSNSNYRMQVRQVKDLILSAHDLQLRERHDKKFLFDIVANGINGIDVDKCAHAWADWLCGRPIF